MTERRPVDNTLSSLWGINVAIGCLNFLSVIILLGAIFVGLALFAGFVRLASAPAGGMIFVVITIPGMFLSILLFSLAMILAGIKAQLLMLRKIQKNSDLTRQSVEVLGESAAHWIQTAAGRPAPQAAEPHAPAPVVVPVQPAPESSSRSGEFHELLSVMTELRDTLLLSENQRAAIVKKRLEQKRRTLIEKFHHHIRHEEWKASFNWLMRFCRCSACHASISLRICCT